MYQIKATLLLLLISLFSQSIFSGEYYKYVVQKGDSLQVIAELASQTPEYIFELNNELGIGLENLRPGIEVFLPQTSDNEVSKCPDGSPFGFIPAKLKINPKEILTSCLKSLESLIDEEIFYDVSIEDFDWVKFSSSRLYFKYYVNAKELYLYFPQEDLNNDINNVNFSPPGELIVLTTDDTIPRKTPGYEDHFYIYENLDSPFIDFLDLSKSHNKFVLDLSLGRFNNDLFNQIDLIGLSHHVRTNLLKWTLEFLRDNGNKETQRVADLLYFFMLDHLRFSQTQILTNDDMYVFFSLSNYFANTDQPEKVVAIYQEVKKFICDSCDLNNTMLNYENNNLNLNFTSLENLFLLNWYGTSAEFIFISNDWLEDWISKKDGQIDFYEKISAKWYEPSWEQFYLENQAYLHSTVATRVLEHQKCEISEKYFEKALGYFNTYIKIENDYHYRTHRDYAYESVYLAECYLIKTKFNKAKEFLSLSSDLLDQAQNIRYVDKILETIISGHEAYIDGQRNLAHQKLKNAYQMIFNIPDNEINIIFQDSISSSLNLIYILESMIKSGEINFLELNRVLNTFSFDNEIMNIKIESENKNLVSLQLELKAIQNEIVLFENKIEKLSDEEFQKLNEAYVEKQDIIGKIFNQSKKINAYLNPSFISTSQIQDRLEDNEYLVIYTFFEHTSWGAILSNKSQHLINLGYGVNSLNQDQTKLKNSINSDFNFEASLDLYESIFKPLENVFVTGSTIKIFNNDNLTVPFEMFTTGENSYENNDLAFINANWLINDYTFTKIFEINLVASNKDFEEEFLGIANSQNFEHLGLAPLTEADLEVIDLGRSSNAKKENILLKEKANKEIFFKKLFKTYEKIVIATHAVPAGWKGFISEPSLILNSKTNDHFLTSSEIAQLDIAADLVILSACNSLENDLNKIYKAFLVAGASTVVYSNWQLDSSYANEFNDALFAELWVNSDLQKHEAVRNVALKFINNYSDPSYANPKFWANFTVGYGNL